MFWGDFVEKCGLLSLSASLMKTNPFGGAQKEKKWDLVQLRQKKKFFESATMGVEGSNVLNRDRRRVLVEKK